MHGKTVDAEIEAVYQANPATIDTAKINAIGKNNGHSGKLLPRKNEKRTVEQGTGAK